MKSHLLLLPPPGSDRSVSALVSTHTEGLALVSRMLGLAVQEVHPQVAKLPEVRSAYGAYVKAFFARLVKLPGRQQELQRLGVTLSMEGPEETWVRMRFDQEEPEIRGILRPKEMGPPGTRGQQGVALSVVGGDADRYVWLMMDPSPNGLGLDSLALVETSNDRDSWFTDGIKVIEEVTIPVEAVTATSATVGKTDEPTRSVSGMIARRPTEGDDRAVEPSAHDEIISSTHTQGSSDDVEKENDLSGS